MPTAGKVTTVPDAAKEPKKKLDKKSKVKQSGRSKSKRKDDTWTKEELTEALSKQPDRNKSKRRSSRHAENETEEEKLSKTKSSRHRSTDEHRSKDDRRSKDERRTKEEHHRSKDERRSRDDRKTEDLLKSKEERHRSKDDRRQKEDHRSKEERRHKEDHHRSKHDHHRSKDDRHRSKDERRLKGDDQRSKDEHRSKDERRHKEHHHRSKDEHRSKEERRHKDDHHRSKDDHHRSKDDRHKSKDERRHKEDHRRSKDEHRSKDERRHKDDHLRSKDKHMYKEETRHGEDHHMSKDDHKRRKEESHRSSKTSKQLEEDNLKQTEKSHENRKQGSHYENGEYLNAREYADNRVKESMKEGAHNQEKGDDVLYRKGRKDEQNNLVEEKVEPTLNKKKAPSKESLQQDNDEYNYDDDEFEDYEDDFEEDCSDSGSIPVKQSSEMNAIIRAIHQENERVASARSFSSDITSANEHDVSSSVSSSKTSHQNFATTINFTGSKQRSRANRNRNKILKRRDDLLPLIQLDVNSFDLFELKPVTEYGFYMKNFGSSNTRQIATQCNDDNLTIDIQTDEIESRDKWSQHPSDGALACGGVLHRVENDVKSEEEKISKIKSILGGDSGNFVNFIRYSSRMVEVMINESTVWGETKNGQNSDLRVCQNYIRYNDSKKTDFMTDRIVTSCDYSNGIIIIAMSPKLDDESDDKFSKNGLITVWKTTNEEFPEKILVCDGIPQVHYYADKKEILFVGTEDGCVLAYDLNEPSCMHHTIENNKNYNHVLRSPTYTTGWMKDIHQGAVVSLNSVGTFDQSNQIFSVDENGLICIWVVVEMLSKVDDDVGLVPYGNVKLVKSLSTYMAKNKNFYIDDMKATCAVCPDANTFFIGTDTGEVRSRSRDHYLKTYTDISHVNACNVNDISFNNFVPWLMLVAYGNGTISLFNIKLTNPVMTWSLDAADVKYCSWSNCRTSVYYSLDSDNYLHTFDLMAIDSQPTVSDRIKQPVTNICVNKQKNKTTDLVLAYENGTFETHRVKGSFCHWASAEGDNENRQLIQLLTSFAQ